MADLDEHHVALRAAEAVLREHGDVRVVGDEDGKRCPLADQTLERLVRPSEVGCGDHRSCGVDDAGRTDADSQNRSGGRGDEPINEGENLRCRLLSPAAREGDLGGREDGAVDVEHSSAEHRMLTEVHPDDLGGGAVHVEQHGGLARPDVVALPEFHHEPVGDELGHQV